MIVLAPHLLPAVLAGAAVAVWLAVPRPGALRVTAVTGGHARRTTTAGPVVHRAPLLGAAGGVVALLTAGPVAAVVATAGGLAAGRVLASRRATRERSSERSRAIEACATLAGELRAGRAAAEALTAAQSVAVGPSHVALAAAAAAAAAGGDVAAALLAHADGRRASAVPELLRALAACWAVCAAAGTGLAAAVERLEEGLRAAEAQRRAVDAELAGPRATAVLLALLPVVGLALAAGLGADPLHVLLHTPAGVVCLLVGVALDALGLLWTARLVARAGGAG